VTEPWPGGRHAVSGPQYLARETIAAAQRRIAPPQPVIPPALMPGPERPALTDADRQALGELIAAKGSCEHCGGVHAGLELACPRLASFELDGDRRIRSGTYWPPGSWQDDRWVAAEEASPPAEAPGDAPG
jgi:hypothetical protein